MQVQRRDAALLPHNPSVVVFHPLSFHPHAFVDHLLSDAVGFESAEIVTVPYTDADAAGFKQRPLVVLTKGGRH